ncbi:MAG: class I tRNA ligase family protein, partial [Rhodothermia bacterium]|nr:class I tRNA ligase family protein [Rhodothermia bacterium]
YPKRWENEYFRWLENIRDWCISRQLWWGHRIPVWYYVDAAGNIDETRGYVVAVDQPEEGMVQDADVLDTWFSSWLWPFATLGWPDEDETSKEDLAYFYPTDVLVSGYDILFFWIARMIMAGLYFTGEVPYRDIFITGMIKDKLGRWMSKSLGNGIDPLEMIEEYGGDAVRYSLTILCAQGQDIKLDPTKFEMGRNFANKIWNAFNVFAQFMEEGKHYERSRPFEELDLAEQWMLHRLNTTIDAVDQSVDRYRLNEALAAIYDVFWRDFCDWYLELIKPPRGEQMEEERIALAVEIFEKMLLLLHPFMPFITEELWQRLRPRTEGSACIGQSWPSANSAEMSEDAYGSFSVIQEMISAIRNVRAEYNVAPSKQIKAIISIPSDLIELRDSIAAHTDYFEKLARLLGLEYGSNVSKPSASASAVVGRNEIYMPLAGMIDLDVERERLQKEIDQKEDFVRKVQMKLQNKQFVDKAPAEVVDRERKKEKDAVAELKRLRSNLADLEAVG